MNKGKIIVFVYGTLKSGEPNHHWLTNLNNGASKFIGNGKTTEKFPMVLGTRYNIPFVVDVRGMGHAIHGEMYEIDENMLVKLDELEGHPHYYTRMLTDIQADNETKYDCWMYFLKQYPIDFLENRPLLFNYTNSSDRPYVPPTQRPVEPKALMDLGYRP